MQIPVATIPYNPPHYIADDVPIPNYLNFTVHNRPPPEPELYPTQYGPLPLPPPLLDYDGYAISDRYVTWHVRMCAYESSMEQIGGHVSGVLCMHWFTDTFVICLRCF